MKYKIFIIFLTIWLNVALLDTVLLAQEFDYHREESPSLSWNEIPIYDARMLGGGGISFFASPSFASAINPALIPRDRRVYSGVSYQGVSFEAFQYWGINQGVIYQNKNLQERDDRISGFSLSFPLNGFRFAAGYRLGNMLQFPYFMYITDSGNYHGTFSGCEKHAFAAIAWGMGQKLDVGLKFDYMWGNRQVDIVEGWFDYPIHFDHQEVHELSCITPALGLTYQLTPNWTLGLALDYPLKGTANRSTTRRVASREVVYEMTNLQSKDTLYRPPKFSLGTSFSPSPGWMIAAETTYYLWSKYKYEFYSEFIPRDMKNIMVMAIATEYGEKGHKVGYNIRAGFRYDPQPLKNPEMTFYGITGGATLQVGNVFFEVGGLYAFGKANQIDFDYLAFTGTFRFFLGNSDLLPGGDK